MTYPPFIIIFKSIVSQNNFIIVFLYDINMYIINTYKWIYTVFFNTKAKLEHSDTNRFYINFSYVIAMTSVYLILTIFLL